MMNHALKYNIAIVDDEPHVLEGINGILDKSNFPINKVKCFQTAEALIDWVKSNQVDLVITDVRMPGVNGLDMVDRVKHILPDVKIIVISGYRDFSYVKEAMELGATNYLVKPIFEEDMLPILNQIFNEFRDFETQKVLENMYPIEALNKYLNGHIEMTSDLEDTIVKSIVNKNALMLSVWEGISGIDFEQIESLLSVDTCKLHIINEDERSFICLLSGFTEQKRDAIDSWLNQSFQGYFDLYNIVDVKDLRNHYELVLKKMHRCHHYKVGKSLLEYDTLFEIADKPVIVANLIDSFEHRNIDAVRASIKQLFRYYDSQMLSVKAIFKDVISIYEERVKTMTHVFKDSQDLSAFYKVPIAFSDMNVEDMLEFVETRLESLLELVNNHRVRYQDQFIDKINQYMTEHLSEPITIRELAQHVHMHPNYLGQKLKMYWQENFTMRLNRMRINASLELMNKKERESLDTIACKVGYKSYQVYLRYFKLFMKQAPSDYLKYKNI